MPEMMYSGCICCYSAFNFDKIFVLCRSSGTCLCVESKQCLAAGEPAFPIGLIKEDVRTRACGGDIWYRWHRRRPGGLFSLPETRLTIGFLSSSTLCATTGLHLQARPPLLHVRPQDP